MFSSGGDKELPKALVSIITPCFNEAENISTCYEQTKKIMDDLLPHMNYEHIFADNCSTDDTMIELRKIAKKDKNVKVIRNSINVGPFRNMYGALKFASGDAIIPMLPADLQDPPEVIPQFIELWEKGNLVIYGKRIKRAESVPMKLIRKIYYFLIDSLSSNRIPRDSGEFMLIDKAVAESLVNTDDHYPYIRGMVAQTIESEESVSYKWDKRKLGKSKSSFVQLIDQGVNGLISTSKIPARISLIIGFAASFMGLLAGLISLVLNVFNSSDTYRGIPTLIVTIFVFGGLQLFFLGLVGEYVLSIHQQVRRNPERIVMEKINFD